MILRDSGDTFTARYVSQDTEQGVQYTFFCDLTGCKVYTTTLPKQLTAKDALGLAQQKAKTYFNRCKTCGRWVCDKAYNMDEMDCIYCSPYHVPPRYCTQCGCPIPTGDHYCTRCGHSIAE